MHDFVFHGREVLPDWTVVELFQFLVVGLHRLVALGRGRVLQVSLDVEQVNENWRQRTGHAWTRTTKYMIESNTALDGSVVIG